MLVLFGVDDPDQAAFQAVNAGVAMFKAVEKLNPYLQTMYGRQFSIRIGIHYGEVVMGSIGMGNIRKLAAFGDAVNLASRIEAANKDIGTHFLISEATYQNVADQVRLKNIFNRQLKGKSGKYNLYEIEGMA
jgi:adenylate cyclase